MAPTPSVLVRKTFSYEGATKQWGNRYHFLGGTPADATHWDTFFDAVVAAEKEALTSRSEIVECVGYGAGSDVPVATKTYTQAGLETPSDGEPQAGEVCVLVRFNTDVRTSKNHPVYLFNYYHGAYNYSSGAVEECSHQLSTVMATYAAAWVAGFSDGTNTYTRAGPNGAAGFAPTIAKYLTHHDFPR